MLNKFFRFINTIRYLRPIQIYFQVLYKLRLSRFFFIFFKKNFKITNKLIWKNYILNEISYKNKNSFEFLNLSHDFGKKIDWNYDGKNLLWLYNLNYFNYLNQYGITKDIGKGLINDYIKNYKSLKSGLDSYPTSLRIINFIKFISIFNIYDKKIIKIIRYDSERLYYNLEYHLLANHLLENAFALFFSSMFFDDNRYLVKSLNIIKNQLNEQIHNDGGHYELSPMYHKIILVKILDLINLIRLNNKKSLFSFEKYLLSKASKMLSWLNNISFSDNSVPLFNDTANKISHNNRDIFLYSEKLNIKPDNLKLSDSGYRKIVKEKFELILDIGNIGCEYQPGHAHADTFSFQLNVDNKPLIVDRGISTYDPGKQRNIERSTKSHNTVCVENKNSSDVWSSFRVGNRARVYNISENSSKISATHDGYKSLSCFHTRSWSFSENQILIKDKMQSENNLNCIAYFHFHPDVSLEKFNDKIQIDKKQEISFQNFSKIEINEYYYSPQFNIFFKAKLVKVHFIELLHSKFSFN